MTINRWRIAVAGVVLQIALGAVGAWSVFSVPLSKQFGWSMSEVTLTFTICVFVLGFAPTRADCCGYCCCSALRSGGWLWVQARRSVQATDTAVLDLRERTAKHLVLDLPIGSKEGPYDVGILSEAGDEVLRASGMAQLNDHVTGLKVDVDLRGVQPGTYSLGVRQPNLEWTQYPIRVF